MKHDGLGSLASLCAALLVSTASRVSAQQPLPSGGTNAGALLSFAIPEAPAFTFLGVSPTKVSRAAAPRDLAVSIVNNLDSAGHVQSGFALGATIWQVIPKLSLPLTSYRSNRLAYALANTQLSIGTAKASGDTTPTRGAIGIRATLYDGSDPMLDEQFVNAFTIALDRCLSARETPGSSNHSATATADSSNRRPDSLRAPAESPKDCAAHAADSLRKTWKEKHWNGPSLSVAAAQGWGFRESAWDKGRPLGWSGWVSGAVPLPIEMQLLGQLQYDQRLAMDTVTRTNVLSFGSRVIRGRDNYNFFVEGVWTISKATRPPAPSQYSAGLEFKAGDSYWLSTGVGKRYESVSKPNQMVILLGIEWGISSESRIGALH